MKQFINFFLFCLTVVRSLFPPFASYKPIIVYTNPDKYIDNNMLSHNFSDFNTFPQFYFLFFSFFIYNPNASVLFGFHSISRLFYISAIFICTYELFPFSNM